MITRSVARKLIALKRAEAETQRVHIARLHFELRRRTKQIFTWANPFYRDQYRREKLVGPMGVWEALQQYQFNVLNAFGLKPHHRVLDVGCGPLTVGLQLVAHLDPGNYVGIDVRHEPLIEAYRLIAKHGLVGKNPTLVNSATFGREELGERRFDFIWVSQLSYHLDDAQIARLFAQIRARMGGTSVGLIDVIDPAIELPANAHWSGFPYYVRPFGFFEAAASAAQLSTRRQGTIGDYGYPVHINLSANALLELRPRHAAA